MAICRISPVPVLRGLGAVYVETIRNLPLLVLLIFIVFGLPDAGIVFPLFACMVIGMGVYAGTYVCEVVRSGILSVPRGEIEAARSLGLTMGTTLRRIVLPTAFRNMIQPLATVLISTVLSTALAASLGVTELTGIATRLQERSAQLLTLFIVVGAGYVFITLSIGLVASRWQQALNRTRTVR
jgi:glutamate transport system permease protein